MRHEDGTDLANTVNELRRELAKQRMVFGALFIGHRVKSDELQFALIFADDMPQNLRMNLLEDLQRALNASKEKFRQ